MIDWTSSGIRNTFRYEKIGLDFSTSFGYMEGVIKGTLTLGYNTDFKRVASLEVVDADIYPNYLIRIWHTAELDGEIQEQCLGTFFISEANADIKNGLYTGSIQLKSPLMALNENMFTSGAVKANQNVMSWFNKVLTSSGCVKGSCGGYDHNTYTFNKARVIDYGTTYLTECHNIANALGGRLDVDDMGGVIIEPYTAPADKPVNAVIPYGEQSLILPSLEIGVNDIVNRTIVKYTKDNKVYTGEAKVADAHPWSFAKLGRWSTKKYDLNEVKGSNATQIRNNLNKYAKERLNELSAMCNTYSFDILYTPVKCGDIVQTVYQDGNQQQEIQGLLTDMQIDLDGAMQTSVVVKEV